MHFAPQPQCAIYAVNILYNLIFLSIVIQASKDSSTSKPV